MRQGQRDPHLRRAASRALPALSCALLALSATLMAGGSARWADAQRLVAPALATPIPAWPDDGAVDHPVNSKGCGQAALVAPGTTARQIVAVSPQTNEGYATREYLIHVPTSYTPARLTPLILVFHGGGGTAQSAEASSGLSTLADQRGFLAVYPQGLPFSVLGPGFTTWAATGPLDSYSNGVDDLRFVSDLLDVLQRGYCVDPRRIYATGFSAGGAMTAFLTCGLTGRIAAFAPMSGDAYVFQGGCAPQHPTSIIEFHGAADPFELYAGVPAREDPDWRRQGVMEWLSGWAAFDGCGATPTTFLHTAAAQGQLWSGCALGEAIVHYRVTGLGHAIAPPIGGRGVYDIMWTFFQAHPLPVR